jgi:exodeoxyribonuclease VII small subunit
MTKTPQKTPKEPAFEQSLERLEKIVGELEEGELPLDDAIGRFEEGLKLVKACRSRLEEAELKIKTLMEQDTGPPEGQ